MTVRGEKWMELSGTRELEVTRHALVMLRRRTGRPLSEDEARECFVRGQQVTPDQMLLLGYRPAYGRRRRKCCQSWYFRLDIGGREAIAVVQEGLFEGQFTWITTYAPNRQSREYRLLEADALLCTA